MHSFDALKPYVLQATQVSSFYKPKTAAMLYRKQETAPKIDRLICFHQYKLPMLKEYYDPAEAVYLTYLLAF